MDPISILVGAGLLLLGLLLGVFATVVLLPRRTPALKTPQAVCSCSHGLGKHDEVHGKCHGEILRKNARTKEGDWIGDQWVTCTCRHYDGPQPIERYLATPTLPPRDGA